MPSLDDVGRLADEAHERAGQGCWEEAARLYAAAGARAVSLGAAGPARRAWDAAGEAFRRADVPVEALRALRVALSLGDGGVDETATLWARVASVLGDLGDGERATEAIVRASEQPVAVKVRALVLDTKIGVIQAYGRKSEWRVLVPQLDGVSAAFRAGQLARLDGDLPSARACFDGVAEVFAGVRGGEAGHAAAACERAEVDALAGEPGPAVEAWTHAASLHRAAGRSSLAWRCEAGRVRASVDAGASVLPGVLDGGIELARRREMVVLEVDLQIARGMARATRGDAFALEDLDGAIVTSDRCGLRIRAGRARMQRAILVPDEADKVAALLVEARPLLEDHVPLSRRLALLLAPEDSSG